MAIDPVGVEAIVSTHTVADFPLARYWCITLVAGLLSCERKGLDIELNVTNGLFQTQVSCSSVATTMQV